MAYDTKTIVLHHDDLEFLNNGAFDWSNSQVEAVVKAAFDQTEIGAQRNFRNFGSSEILGGTAHSQAAYIETDAGYFIISADMLEHIIVTYARWD